MIARNGTGICVTHEVQSLASMVLYGEDCRTPLNRTVSGGWTYTNLTHQVYEKFYVHHGMFIYGMYDETCDLGWLNLTDCVDMYFTETYAAILVNNASSSEMWVLCLRLACGQRYVFRAK